MEVAHGWAGKTWIQHIFLRYKITFTRFQELWDCQEGKCAGCEKSFAHPIHKLLKMGERPEVDHDHETGKVRGLLCRKCNDFLGKIKDNRETLERLRAYLERNGEML
jgi:hypothetical protein